MYDLWLIVVSTALVNNVVLTQLVGGDAVVLDGFGFGRVRTIAWTSGVVLILAGALAFWIEQLAFGDASFGGLRLFVTALLCVALSLPVERLAQSISPIATWRTEQRVPLVMANATVLGGALITTGSATSIGAALAMLVAVAAGFAAVLFVMAALHARLDAADVPRAFRGGPISIITLGLLALALQGLAGMVHA